MTPTNTELSGLDLAAWCAKTVLGIPDAEDWGVSNYPCFLAHHDHDPQSITIFLSLRASRSWNPLTSMSDAWEPIRALQSQGWGYSLNEMPEAYWRSRGGRYRAVFYQGGVECLRHGDTEGEAILRAALAAKEAGL